MDNVPWLPIAIIVIFALAGQSRKLLGGSRKMQAGQPDRQAQLQAAAAAQAAQAAQAAAVRAAAAAAGAAVRAAPAPPPPMPPPLRTSSTPYQPAIPIKAQVQPAHSGHNFIRDAFADPIHARRAVVLGEILLPPPALR